MREVTVPALMAVFVFLVLGPAGAIEGALPAQPTAPPAAEAEAAAISVKTTEPAQVAYLLHVGPYWQVGPKFARLREYMQRHQQPGPMYARYLDAPVGVPADALRTEIGFFVHGDHVPELPFELADRPSEQVASMYVSRPFATVSRHYAVLHRWAAEHHYAAVGPVTEIYTVTAEALGDAPPTEVQMTVTKVEVMVEEKPAPPVTSVAEASADAGALPPAPPVDALAIDSPRDQPAGSDVPAPPGSPPQDLAGGSAGYSESPEPVAPETAATQLPPPALEAGYATAGPPTDDTTGDPPEPTIASPLVPVAVLIEQGKFDQLAEQLLPADQPYAPLLEAWVGQVVHRIIAVSAAFQGTDAEADDVLSAFGDAIKRRYELVAAGFRTDPLAHPTWRITDRTDPDGEEKRAIIRALDLVMGRISHGSLDAESCLGELIGITQRFQELVHRDLAHSGKG